MLFKKTVPEIKRRAIRFLKSIENNERVMRLLKVHAIKGRVMRLSYKNVYIRHGYCPICEKVVTFYSSSKQWFRDHLFCSKCGSIPRERALMKVIKDFYPNFTVLDIHESSPGARGASLKLRKLCKNYTASQYYTHIPFGHVHPKSGYRSENLEQLTFPDNSFDLLITQDVMEHILDPEKAFKEIARVLKPGGAHIFTVPLIRKKDKSERCALRTDKGEIIHLSEPRFHGNPVDKKGALVTMNWGWDIAGFITETAKTPTTIIMIDNIDLGIRAEFIDVLMSTKCSP